MLNVCKNSNIKIKLKAHGKIYLYFRCVDCGFIKFETIDKNEQSDLLTFYTIYKTILFYCLKCRKKQKLKARNL